ncbi:MAG TPA: hypothetical protein PKK12_00030 [Candidatus Aminicenantes bacterium]|nr:hypothetical protein [Candidatus Aminicenantes bacterium]
MKRLIGRVVFSLVLGLLLTQAGPAQTSESVAKQPQLGASPQPVPSLLLKLPDLRVRKIWFARFVANPSVTPLVPITGDLKAGVKVWMVCDLDNAGLTDVIGLWQLGFFIDDVMVWNNSWGNLAAGKTLRGLGPYTPAGDGVHNFRCFLDAQKVVKERNENNNQLEVLFKVVK